MLDHQILAAVDVVAISGAISLADSRRIMEARRMIDQRCHEKLTLDAIARACGLNRAKLTRGFREMFDCTIAEALTERRLQQAQQMSAESLDQAVDELMKKFPMGLLEKQGTVADRFDIKNAVIIERDEDGAPDRGGGGALAGAGLAE